MLFSVIIPVYNRPFEVDELLLSLLGQTRQDFEVIIVEDGSSETSELVVAGYSDRIDVKYFFKSNSGPGLARNYGAARSVGDYLIFLDSDCVLPPGYLEEVGQQLSGGDVDAFGGPDRASASFTNIQKAINYSMTSFFTTGGIRGGDMRVAKFHPRSFNMGVRRGVFEELGGFSAMRFGEDIDLSTRIYEGGFSAVLFSGAWVYHKRRTDFRKFFKQVYNSGVARVVMLKRRPNTFRVVYILPALFTVCCVGVLVGAFFAPGLLLLLLGFCLVILGDSASRIGSFVVGFLAVLATFVQLFGYGFGFLVSLWRVLFLGDEKYTAFEKNFYK